MGLVPPGSKCGAAGGVGSSPICFLDSLRGELCPEPRDEPERPDTAESFAFEDRDAREVFEAREVPLSTLPRVAPRSRGPTLPLALAFLERLPPEPEPREPREPLDTSERAPSHGAGGDPAGPGTTGGGVPCMGPCVYPAGPIGGCPYA